MSSVKPVEDLIHVMVCVPAGELSEDPGFEVRRADGPDEIRACLDEARVDCAVLGLEQAGGPDGLRRLRACAPSTAFVILASDPDEVREAVRAGADRCLPAGEVSGPMLSVAVTEALARYAAGAGPAAASAETVSRLARAIEHRDPETSSHIERMSAYCALLAGHAGLNVELNRVASRLHDLGKVAVPDSILLKPGPLTASERRTVERHAQVGCRLLHGSGLEFLDHASQIALTHHERFDGGGYPRGLAGEQIPAAGRIAALADAFDALSTDRVYRRALPFDEAVATLRDERGRQFDPELVAIFLDELDTVQAIMERFPDDPGELPARREPELLTLQEAASALGVSQSRLRRWSDEGRIGAVRTAGGHRRFALDAVRTLASELGRLPGVRPAQTPARPLPTLAERLAADGPQLATTAAASLYRGGTEGWFASPDAEPALETWLAELRVACARGRYAGAVAATEVLMRRAYVQNASLLERHSFLERLALAAQRALALAGAPREEVAGTRRLFAALQQHLLDGLA